MRKFLLIAALAAAVQISSAQAPVARPLSLRNPRIQPRSNEDRPVVLTTQGSNTSVVNNHSRTTNTNKEKSLLNGTPLSSQAIGTSGNLLTITTGGCNQLSVNNQLHLVSFIHRSDPTVNAQANIAEYSLDFSKDGGNTWKSNVGPITNAPNIDNNGTDPHGRFPLGLIFNPAGNIIPDSAYEIYSGTWHNAPVSGTNGSWVGQMRGRGHFTGDSSTFNVHIDTINNGVTDIATGMIQGAPGVFWAVNTDWTGTFSTSSNDITNGVIVEKGVWDQGSRDVVWTAHEIPAQFDSFNSASVVASAAQSFDIAFDPTGQIGWIACIGDITTNPTDSVLSPIFWKTTDGGNTWSNATQITLDSLPGVANALNLNSIYPVGGNAPGALTSGVPTSAFEGKLTVDYAGNPHYLITVGNGLGYSIQSGAGYIMYDITLNPADTACRPTFNGWAAVFVDSVATLRGNTTADGTPLTEDNRPLVSRSEDGKTIFFFWEASDPNYPDGSALGDDNSNPNLFARGFDVQHSTSTPVVNLTQGDPLWGGANNTYNAGIYNGAFYPTISPIALNSNNGFTIPLVLTQIDYTTGTDMSGDPAQFWYVKNVNFSQFDFTNGLAATLTPIGQDTIVVPVGTGYSDLGATITYLDTACSHSGSLHVVSNTSDLDTLVPGSYTIYYAAEDANGNIYATGQRTVLVVSAPVANFGYANVPNQSIQFSDSSLYGPTSWAWTFGDGASDNSQNPNHQYTVHGMYNVCLTATNAYGSSAQVCKNVNVPNGIKQIDFSSTVNLFPNPTNSNVSITLSGNAIPDFTLNVYNVLGEQVIATSEHKAGTTNVELNAGSLADGIYLVKIQSNAGSAVKRLTVSHK